MPSQPLQAQPAVKPGVGVPGVDGKRPVDRCQGIGVTVQGLQDGAVLAPGNRVFRVEGEGLLVARQRLFVAAKRVPEGVKAS